jgi:hypothetical protein
MPPQDSWYQRYAETLGADEAARLHAGFRRLTREQREAIAQDLLKDTP